MEQLKRRYSFTIKRLGESKFDQ